jgi:hypothetical protein
MRVNVRLLLLTQNSNSNEVHDSDMNCLTWKGQSNGRGFPADSDEILIRRSHGELQKKYCFQIPHICSDRNSFRLVQNTVASLLTPQITRQMTERFLTMFALRLALPGAFGCFEQFHSYLLHGAESLLRS